VIIEKKRGDNENSNARIRYRKENRMEKKLAMLKKRYPSNKYEINEIETKGGKVIAIVRTEGRRPHKVSKKIGGVK